jgi:uncharacterized protein YjiS (DUF1127 family)
MAHYTMADRALAGPVEWIEGIRDAWHRRRVYTAVLDELQSLTDRELEDVGIARFAIRDVAREAAYGKPGA